MFNATDNAANSQFPVRVLVGNKPGEGEPYPLAVALANDPHYGGFDRAMSQFALGGYQNLKVITDAYVVT